MHQWLIEYELHKQHHLYNSLTCSTELLQLDDHFCSLTSSSDFAPSHWHNLSLYWFTWSYYHTSLQLMWCSMITWYSRSLDVMTIPCIDVDFLLFGPVVTIRSSCNNNIIHEYSSSNPNFVQELNTFLTQSKYWYTVSQTISVSQ